MKNIFVFLSISILCVFSFAKDESQLSNKNVLASGALKGTQVVVVPVTVDEDGIPRVLVDPIIVKEGQRVIWVGPKNLEIDFLGNSPFYSPLLKAKNSAVNMSVPVQEFEGNEKVFKYDVIVNGVRLDPMMIVRKVL